jgi:hypothetical protein
MAWSASKIFSAYITDALNNTAALDGNADTFKAALWDDSITPSQTVATASSILGAGVWASGQLSNGGWTSGGLALGSVASGFSSNVYTFDAADTANGSAATIASAVGAFVYNDTTGDQGLCYNYFGGANSVTAGTLTIQWHASGIMALTL